MFTLFSDIRRNSVLRWELRSDTVVERWLELKQRYMALRGQTRGAESKPIPKTTLFDVLQVATHLSKELAKVEPRGDLDENEHERWRSCVKRIASVARRIDKSEEYPHNEEFWQKCTFRLAVYLDSLQARPSRWSMFTESVTEAFEELPGTVGRATKSAAKAAAGVLSDPAKLAAVLLGGAILAPPIIRAMRR